MIANRSKHLLGGLWIAAALAGGCRCNDGQPRAKPAARGLDDRGQMQIGEGDRCPVCAMRVTRHRRFVSAIELDDRRVYYFCGTGCMIKSWLHPEVFLGANKAALRRAVTREYFGGRQIDAASARWVAGSDVVGPMGRALVPLRDDADVAVFRRRHGGDVVFTLDELNDARFNAITGKEAARWPAK